MSGWIDALKALRQLGQPALLAGCALGLGIAAAAAQQAQEVPKSSAYVPPKEATKEESSWVKICTKGADAGAKQVCLVRHEGLELKTGQILIAAAVRSVDGDPKQRLLINLPTAYSLVIPTGVQIKIDDGKPVPLQYTVCLKTNCQVELELSKDMLAEMRNGSKLLIAAMNTQGKTMAFPIPLTGFGKTTDGPPVDNVAYQAARMQMIEAARQRQKQATSGAP
jgi:invasion protein IalB